jgi:RNA polymerase sigma-70 factor (ECF subfamily)
MCRQTDEAWMPDAISDDELLPALRAGDEAAFAGFVQRYHGALVRVAMLYVGNRDVAEEVAQEAWIGVLKGLESFQGRSSLKTWVFSILTNCAKTRAQREARYVAFSAFAGEDEDGDEPAVDPDRFLPADDARWPGHWTSAPRRWEHIPEDRLMAQETLAHVRAAIEELPPNQRRVLVLRDVEGLTSEDVCALLGISVSNERVLLHRGRSRVRRALERYFEDGDPLDAHVRRVELAQAG